MLSPYRTRAAIDESLAGDTEGEGFPDAEVIVVLLAFWIASIARVGTAIARHEALLGETTLALLAVVLVPLLLKGGRVRAWWTRRRRGRGA
jgi:hypothetical protein